MYIQHGFSLNNKTFIDFNINRSLFLYPVDKILLFLEDFYGVCMVNFRVCVTN